jgi:hypothetical protein
LPSNVKQCHLAEGLSRIQTGYVSRLLRRRVRLAENIDLALGNDVEGISRISRIE